MASDLRMTSFWRLSLRFSRSHLTLGQEGTTALGLGISNSLGILQLGPEEDLCLVHVGDVILKLLNLPVEVLVLNLEMLLGRLSLIESSGHLVQSCVGGGLNQLALLVKLGLAFDSILKIKTSLTKVIVLLILDLVGIKRLSIWKTPPGGSALKRSRSELDSWVCSRSSSCFHASFWKHLPWPCSHAKEHPQLHEELLQAFPLCTNRVVEIIGLANSLFLGSGLFLMFNYILILSFRCGTNSKISIFWVIWASFESLLSIWSYFKTPSPHTLNSFVL